MRDLMRSCDGTCHLLEALNPPPISGERLGYVEVVIEALFCMEFVANAVLEPRKFARSSVPAWPGSPAQDCKTPSRLKLDTITAIQSNFVKALPHRFIHVLEVYFPFRRTEVLLRDPHTYIDVAAVLPMVLRIEAGFVLPPMSDRPFSHYVLVSWPWAVDMSAEEKATDLSAEVGVVPTVRLLKLVRRFGKLSLVSHVLSTTGDALKLLLFLISAPRCSELLNQRAQELSAQL